MPFELSTIHGVLKYTDLGILTQGTKLFDNADKFIC